MHRDQFSHSKREGCSATVASSWLTAVVAPSSPTSCQGPKRLDSTLSSSRRLRMETLLASCHGQRVGCTIPSGLASSREPIRRGLDPPKRGNPNPGLPISHSPYWLGEGQVLLQCVLIADKEGLFSYVSFLPSLVDCTFCSYFIASLPSIVCSTTRTLLKAWASTTSRTTCQPYICSNKTE